MTNRRFTRLPASVQTWSCCRAKRRRSRPAWPADARSRHRRSGRRSRARSSSRRRPPAKAAPATAARPAIPATDQRHRGARDRPNSSDLQPRPQPPEIFACLPPAAARPAPASARLAGDAVGRAWHLLLRSHRADRRVRGSPNGPSGRRSPDRSGRLPAGSMAATRNIRSFLKSAAAKARSTSCAADAAERRYSPVITLAPATMSAGVR